jgi:tetratricopeptide (TPR) repeat protein
MNTRRRKKQKDPAALKSSRGTQRPVRRPSERRRNNRAGSPTNAVPLKNVVWISAVLIAITLFVYSPVRHYGFLSYDDPLYVSENPQVMRGLTGPGILWAFKTGHSANWHPITWLSHMFDIQLHGMDAGRHHFTNVLLHIANAILLFGILYRTTGAWGKSAAVAALFAVHPLHVESVAWIAERKDVLSTLFWMLTIHAYLNYIHRPRLRRYVLVIAVFAIGLMSKPMLVTLPLILILMDIWPLGRVRFEAGQRNAWLKLIREKIPFVALAAASSIATVIAQWQGGAVQNFEILPLHLRIANAAVSYAAYIGQMAWPFNLAAYYPYEPFPLWWAVLSSLGLILVSAAVIRFSKRLPFLLMGWLWYLIAALPVIGLVQVGGQARADRYTYVPLIGVFIIVAWGIPHFLRRRRHYGISLSAAACILIGSLSVAARNQVRYWSSDLKLWNRTVQVTNDNWLARTNLGLAYADLGDTVAAINQYTEALRIHPNCAESHNALGVALFAQGRLEKAIEQYTEAIAIEPEYADARSNRGTALWKQGRIDEAFSEFHKSIKISPDDPEINYNLAFALADYGRTDEAITYYRKALASRPRYAEAYLQLGNILARKEVLHEAVDQYSKALRINPDYSDAHNNLGVVLMRQKRYKEAIAHFSEALRIDPGNIKAQNNLNMALEEQQNDE